jgi:hypothetical protein
MKPFGVAVLAVFVAMIATTASAVAAPPPSNTPGYEDMCDGLTWPRPVPAVTGLIFDGKYEFGQLACLLGARVIDADGNVVYENGRSTGLIGPHRIVEVSPPPGTPIGRHDAVTVKVVHENVGPSGPGPCDWVTTPEASTLLDGLPVAASAFNDHEGSTDFACGYRSDDGSRGVTAWLSLAGAYIVDAATAFDFQTSHGNADVTSIGDLGIAAACVLRNHPSGQRNHLWIVLPGERLLIVSDAGDPGVGPGEACDTLTEFARIAIPRLEGVAASPRR